MTLLDKRCYAQSGLCYCPSVCHVRVFYWNG